MGELLQETEVFSICKLLEDHKGGDVVALDLRKLNLWTDFFIIATVASGVHLQGILRHVKEFAATQGLSIQRWTQKDRNASSVGGAGSSGSSNNGSQGGWSLIDMGTVVIHLMTAQSREFYELEALWSSAGQMYPKDYSSKSS